MVKVGRRCVQVVCDDMSRGKESMCAGKVAAGAYLLRIQPREPVCTRQLQLSGTGSRKRTAVMVGMKPPNM